MSPSCLAGWVQAEQGKVKGRVLGRWSGRGSSRKRLSSLCFLWSFLEKQKRDATMIEGPSFCTLTLAMPRLDSDIYCVVLARETRSKGEKDKNEEARQKKQSSPDTIERDGGGRKNKG